jgi:hypothetical protein
MSDQQLDPEAAPSIFALFLAVAAHLNHELSIIPVLYGSLGLRRAIDTRQVVGDIDLLVPATFLGDRWHELVAAMKQLDFVLVDVREHEFQRGATVVVFADEESLLSFAGVNPTALAVSTTHATHFRELTPRDYLAVYRASQQDGYRQAKRGKRDAEKILLIEQFLEHGSTKRQP